MATEERQPDTALRKLVFEEFRGLSFFRAVQLIELLDSRRKVGESLSPSEEPVRFKVKPGLGFPPSDIVSVRETAEEKSVEMQVSFMGLLGAAGALPYWYTTLAMERLAAKDTALTSFLDIFHHRLISLFYQGWKKNRFAARYLAESRDRCSTYFLSLIGLGTGGLAGRTGFLTDALVYCGGQLSRQVCPAGSIEATVAYCLGIEVSLEQFLDRKIEIEPEDRTRLGFANSRMGVDAVCGWQAWESQSRFRLKIGPVSYRQFLMLMPDGKLLKPLVSLVSYLAGAEYEFEVRPYLKRGEVPGCVIGKPAPDSPRLGWSTWMKTPGVPMGKDPHVTFEAAGLR